MTKFLITISSLIILIPTLCFGQNTWTKTFSSNSPYNEGVAVFAVQDSGYWCIANTNGFNGNNGIYIFKTDKDGNLLKDMMLSKSYHLKAEDAKFHDDHFYIVGNSKPGSEYKALFMKVDTTGQIKWQKNWGSNGWKFANDLLITSTGDLFIAGKAYNGLSGNSDALIIKSDLSGNIYWSKTYGGQGDEGFYSIDTSDATTLIAAGFSNSYSNDTDFYFVQTNLLGDTIWTSSFGEPGEDIVYDFAKDIRTGYHAAGSSEGYNSEDKDPVILYVTDSAKLIWAAHFGGKGDGAFYHIMQQQVDSSLISVGTLSGIYTNGKSDAYLQSSHRNGYWQPYLPQFIIGGDDYDMGTNFAHTLDNGYIVIGTSLSFGDAASNIFLIKADSLGATVNWTDHTMDIENSDKLSFEINLYPNPASEYININFGTDTEILSLKLINLKGEVLTELTGQKASVIKLKTDDLSSGIYLIRMVTNHGVFTKALNIIK